ncbi:MAG: Asp-tRNA(Asn)/Glu-tRNA(Gln) amidotransferase subunit GatB, partial [Halanaerobium sp. MSAO_Bac5]
LAKAYQISQFDLPIAENGNIEIETDNGIFNIGVTRVHLEEDAGKLVHEGSIDKSEASLVDYNRSGVPLIEIVSEPDIRTPAQAKAYLTELKLILEYLEISDCNMEEGSLRCDANVSLRPEGQKEFGTKAELKNMNSFSAVEKGLEYEVKRQQKLLDEGQVVVQETRTWDEDLNKTISMRGKEEAHDYRYFPDPDLLPLEINQSWKKEIRERLPELPREKYKRFISEFSLPAYDAGVITGNREMAEFFEAVLKDYNDPKNISNWMMGEFLRLLNENNEGPYDSGVSPENLSKMLKMIDEDVISGKIAKKVFEIMYESGKDPEKIVEEEGLKQISDEDELESLVDQIIAANPDAVEDIKNGKDRAIGFLVGQIMKETRGKANPGLVNQMLRDKLMD